MIKVLWLGNIILPEIAERLGQNAACGGGWITGMINQIKKQEDFEIVYCFCMNKSNEVISGEIDGIRYYAVPKKYSSPIRYEKQLEKHFCDILKIEKPEVVHIFGSEFPHTLSMVRSFNNPKRTVINIQGLVSICSKHFMACLPANVQKGFTLRDFIRQDNLIQQQRKFEKRGQFEIEALKNVNHVIGRTTWDRVCTKQINNKVKYHFCNETIRDEFYTNRIWDIDKCEKNSIFVSQGYYPLKGLHFLIEAMPLILALYPETKLYIAGSDITKKDTLINKIKIPRYGEYILQLIKKHNLENRIFFTGILNETQMCERFLKSNVFVSPSIIENESNSLSEAKMLGVPCVTSYVGGVTDRIRHDVDGFAYQADAPYMLAYYVCEIFKNRETTLSFSKNAREHAIKTLDREENTRRLAEIYKEITEDKS